MRPSGRWRADWRAGCPDPRRERKAILSVAALLAPVPLSIALGLFVGKQIGVFLPAAALILLRLAPMPAGGTWLKLYGVSVCAGIGFTMSLFIGSLAWEDPAYAAPLRLGVIVGSLVSAVFAFVVIYLTSSRISSSLTVEKTRLT